MAQLSCGIIGLPNAGKSTLFNALTRAGAETAAYPFCTIDPNIGSVPVHDPRLDRVAELVDVDNIIYHTVEYVDVAGLVKDASKGAGRGNQFLEHVRNCHALVHVVRCFEDPDVAHVHGVVNPLEDIRTVNLELILADLQTVEKAVDRLRKHARREADAKAELEFLEKLQAHLNEEKPAHTLDASKEQRHMLDAFRLLSAKAVLYAANIGEGDLPGTDHEHVKAMASLAASEGNAVVPICAELEEELAKLAPDEARLFLDDMGITEPGLQRLVRETCKLLGLISFFTFNEKEARAWTIPAGAFAQQAAGVIHTDFAEKFIRAEVTPFKDFDAAGGTHGAREKGLMRIEGRDHVVNDADVIYFRIAP